MLFLQLFKLQKDELIKKEPVKVKVATVEPEPVKNVKKSTKSESSVKNVIVIPQNCVVTNVGKEKKKKKSEYNTLQQLSTYLKHCVQF